MSVNTYNIVHTYYIYSLLTILPYTVGEDSKSVDAGSRDGSGNNAGKALNGTNHKFYYRTPASLFSNTNPYDADAADTVSECVCVYICVYECVCMCTCVYMYVYVYIMCLFVRS